MKASSDSAAPDHLSEENQISQGEQSKSSQGNGGLAHEIHQENANGGMETLEALKESERHLQLAHAAARLGSWDWRYGETFARCSGTFFALHGLEPDAEGRLDLELYLSKIHPEDQPRIRELTSKAISGVPYGEIKDNDFRYIMPDGSLRWMSAYNQPIFENGKLSGITGVTMDITERKQGEEALKQSREMFRSLADAMPQLVWSSGADGVIDYYNHRLAEYDGVSSEEDARYSWAAALHPDDLHISYEAWMHAVQTGETFQIEHRMRIADGSYRWHLSRGVPLRDETGQVIRWYGTSTDIQDLKEAQQAIATYVKKLEDSNKELQEFAFIASHDMQEPLRKIESFSRLLLARTPDNFDEQQRDYLDRIRSAVDRMRTMIDDLLLLSRVSTKAQMFTRIDLNQVITEVLSDLEERIRAAGGRVEVESLPSIEGDSTQIHQLLLNLISNAIKFTRPGMPPLVHVKAGRILISGHQLGSPARQGVELVVEDNGIGFDESRLEQVFQPFQRLVGRSQYEGSGIGLAICRKIVERHGGEITANSSPGVGSTFRVLLPLHQTRIERNP
jgi:PAS domain S-box-containing protein